jgi:hypothetical protein
VLELEILVQQVNVIINVVRQMTTVLIPMAPDVLLTPISALMVISRDLDLIKLDVCDGAGRCTHPLRDGQVFLIQF